MPSQPRSLLNDLSGPMRVATAVQGVGLGLVLGLPVAGAAGHPVLGGVLVLLGMALLVPGMIGLAVWLRRADRVFWRDLARLSAELADGRVDGVTVPGRVVRRRIAAGHPSWSTSSPDPQPGPSAVLVATVLSDEGARRAAALVPAQVGPGARRAPVLLRLHPTRADVAVLVTDATPEEHRAADADPRWATDPLPTEGSVVGGYLVLLAVGVSAAVLALGAVALLVLAVG